MASIKMVGKNQMWRANYMGYRSDGSWGRVQHKTGICGAENKSRAQAKANDMEAKALLRHDGLVSDIPSDSPITWPDAFSELQTSLISANVSVKHRADCLSIVSRFTDHARRLNITNPAAVKNQHVESFLVSLSHNGRPASPKTREKYLIVLKSFLKRFGVRSEQLKDLRVLNPLPVTERRMLKPEEWAYLKAYLTYTPRKIKLGRKFNDPMKNEDIPASLGPRVVNYKLSPAQRRLIYSTMISTGLRVSETRSLTAQDLRHDGTPTASNGTPDNVNANSGGSWYLCVAAAKTKGKRVAKQYIPDTLAADLQNHLPLGVPRAENAYRMFKRDVLDAQAHYRATTPNFDPDFLSLKTSEGQLTLHCLRHSYISFLAMNRTPIVVLTKLARHKNVQLTISRYSHLMPGAEAEEVKRCPWF